MKTDKKQLLIYIGIISIVGVVVVSYIINKTEDENNNYDQIQLETTKTSELNNVEKIIVHVAGSVVNEGIVELEEGARMADAIEEAGGTTAEADLKNINLAYKLQDGQKIYIPNINEEDEINLQEEIENKSNNEFVNINTATQTELELLNGIGPSLAGKIIEYRNKNGKFKNIEELKNIPGIGETKYEAIKDNITI